MFNYFFSHRTNVLSLKFGHASKIFFINVVNLFLPTQLKKAYNKRKTNNITAVKDSNLLILKYTAYS